MFLVYTCQRLIGIRLFMKFVILIIVLKPNRVSALCSLKPRKRYQPIKKTLKKPKADCLKSVVVQICNIYYVALTFEVMKNYIYVPVYHI